MDYGSVRKANPMNQITYMFLRRGVQMFRHRVRRCIMVVKLNRMIKGIEDGTIETFPVSTLWDNW